jgi:hypothetical protein
VFGEKGVDVRFTTTIPSGARTCHFDIYRKDDASASDWNEYSGRLRARALKLVDRKD